MKAQTLAEVAEDSPCGGEKWCFLREYFLHLGSDRTAMQMRLMLDFRFVLGKKENRSDVTTEEASMRWREEGYALRFAEIYDNHTEEHHQQLKKQLFGDI